VVAISSLAFAPAAAQEADHLPAVLITGTSSGIGLRMTEVLSQNGFFVYAGARKPADLERPEAMENVKSVRLDVTIQREIDAAVEFVRSEGRGLYGLIKDVDFIIDVNVMGPYRVTKAFADLLIESGGRVATVTSIAGILSGPFIGPYSMTKHAVEAYTDALAAEMGQFGVAVAAVEPGNYKSEVTASMVRRMNEAGYSAEGSRYPSMLDLVTGPIDRSQYKEPDEVAQAALDFLTSDSPKRRYMVVPNQVEAEITIRQALREAVQLNEGQPYTYSRDELVVMLDEVLEQARPATSGSDTQSESSSEVGLHEAAWSGDVEAVRELIESAGRGVESADYRSDFRSGRGGQAVDRGRSRPGPAEQRGIDRAHRGGVLRAGGNRRRAAGCGRRQEHTQQRRIHGPRHGHASVRGRAGHLRLRRRDAQTVRAGAGLRADRGNPSEDRGDAQIERRPAGLVAEVRKAATRPSRR
jgi:NAD(P)-dependent dehydrogenase (short-subunit alcohol dehydrogenase family)